MHRSTAFAIAAVLLFARSATPQALTFERDDYASYPGARAIVTADFDRDGWSDLAQANAGRNTVTILLNERGAVRRDADIPVGLGPFGLVTSDFNRDGIPDLAVANADSDSISILLGRPAGGFVRADIATSGANPRGLAVADVNNDGKPDLIYTAYASRLVHVLLGTGKGHFKSAAIVTTAANPQGLAAADFNRDGFVDVAVAHASSGGLRILYGNGGTAFSGRNAGGVYLNAVTAADFDADGWVDVAAVSTSSGTVGVFRGGAGGVAHAATYVTGPSPRGLSTADVNCDGAVDLITANRAANTVSVMLADRTHPGTFLPRADVDAGTGSRDVVAVDLNADGRIDLATGNQYAAVTTVLSNSTRFTGAAYAFEHVIAAGPPQSARLVRTADFNGDGRLDAAVADSASGSVVVVLTGGAVVSLAPTPAFAVGDFNGDTTPDVAYAAFGPAGAAGVFLGNGRGAFTAAPETPLPWAYGGFMTVSMGAADLNRDGRLDLVYADFDHGAVSYAMQVLLGRGDGTFKPGLKVFLPGHADELRFTDVNRDGKPDIVLAVPGYAEQPSAAAHVWLGNGAGRLRWSGIVSFEERFGAQLDIDDVNHDGFVDIVASGLQHMSVALGGTTGFASPVYTVVRAEDLYLGDVAIGDLNVDGHPDVAFGSGDLMFGNGDGTFISGGRFDYGYANSVGVVDFTGDGLPGIVAAKDEGLWILRNLRSEINHAPAVDAGPDRIVDYAATQREDCDFSITAAVRDPDAHALTYEWRRNGEPAGSAEATVYLCGPLPGTSVYSLTVRDGRGGEATDTVTVTMVPVTEIVLWASAGSVEGNWSMVDDPTAAGGQRAYNPDLRAPKVAAPLENPPGFLLLRFVADPTQTYRLWIRLKADRNFWGNDSVWVQFSESTDLSGAPRYRIGTTSGLVVNLEECIACGESGWGWEDNGWGAVNENGTLLRFTAPADPGEQYILIQTREDGVSVDQVVLSAAKYLTARPGAAKNDRTILPSTQR